MASITSIDFDQASYVAGHEVTAVVNYVPDAPNQTAEPFTLSVSVMNSAGTEVAANSATFTVNTPQPAGDKVHVSDSGNRTWTEVSDNGSVAVFTATA